MSPAAILPLNEPPLNRHTVKLSGLALLRRALQYMSASFDSADVETFVPPVGFTAMRSTMATPAVWSSVRHYKHVYKQNGVKIWVKPGESGAGFISYLKLQVLQGLLQQLQRICMPIWRSTQ